MKIFEEKIVRDACEAVSIKDISHATIGETVLLSQYLEKKTGIPFIRMDQGSPTHPMNRVGIEAEKKALDSGLGSTYPAAPGIAQLQAAASRFVKAFIDVDIQARSCIATTGSVAASFGSFATVTRRIPGKDKILFIDPGFPIQKSQLRILGLGWRSFDIFPYRGAAKLEPVLEDELSKGDIAAIVYSNPNNPCWICLEQDELEVIGRLATKYDVVVMEDLAYFCMDYRKELGHPYEAPFVPTVAKYTDNYILMLSASKIFGYAGQRIALCCVSDKLYEKQYPALAERFGDAGVFGVTLTASVLYMITSGCTYSTQVGYAEMLNRSCDGEIDFVEDTRVYERRAHSIKEIFCRHGFNVVYDMDVTQKVGDGFFFTLGYKDMTSSELVVELLYYGVSTISLSTTGSEQNGVRVCVSPVREESFAVLDERMEQFETDHR